MRILRRSLHARVLISYEGKERGLHFIVEIWPMVLWLASWALGGVFPDPLLMPAMGQRGTSGCPDTLPK